MRKKVTLKGKHFRFCIDLYRAGVDWSCRCETIRKYRASLRRVR